MVLYSRDCPYKACVHLMFKSVDFHTATNNSKFVHKHPMIIHVQYGFNQLYSISNKTMAILDFFYLHPKHKLSIDPFNKHS